MNFKFKNFFDNHPDQGSSARNVKVSIDNLNANIRWIKNNFNTLNNWLAINIVDSVSEKIDYRLPKNLIPYNYDVSIKAQLDTLEGNSFPYDGEVTISFSCIENTNSLIFHINKLLINNATLSVKSITDSSFTEIKGFGWTNDYKRQFFVANLAQEFKANHNYSVFMQFIGYLTDDNAGFYRSSYLDNNQQKRWLFTSQMEPTDARKSFPCFDEPAMKATFKIKVEHKPSYNASSNMPIASKSIQ